MTSQNIFVVVESCFFPLNVLVWHFFIIINDVCFRVRRMLTCPHRYSEIVESSGPAPNLLHPYGTQQNSLVNVKHLDFIAFLSSPP